MVDVMTRKGFGFLSRNKQLQDFEKTSVPKAVRRTGPISQLLGVIPPTNQTRIKVKSAEENVPLSNYREYLVTKARKKADLEDTGEILNVVVKPGKENWIRIRPMEISIYTNFLVPEIVKFFPGKSGYEYGSRAEEREGSEKRKYSSLFGPRWTGGMIKWAKEGSYSASEMVWLLSKYPNLIDDTEREEMSFLISSDGPKTERGGAEESRRERKFVAYKFDGTGEELKNKESHLDTVLNKVIFVSHPADRRVRQAIEDFQKCRTQKMGLPPNCSIILGKYCDEVKKIWGYDKKYMERVFEKPFYKYASKESKGTVKLLLQRFVAEIPIQCPYVYKFEEVL